MVNDSGQGLFESVIQTTGLCLGYSDFYCCLRDHSLFGFTLGEKKSQEEMWQV
jgi:hypothetical protein